jgi:hypothetical protein
MSSELWHVVNSICFYPEDGDNIPQKVGNHPDYKILSHRRLILNKCPVPWTLRAMTDVHENVFLLNSASIKKYITNLKLSDQKQR